MRTIALILLFVGGIAVAAPAPFPKPKKGPDASFEIDFRPLEAVVAPTRDWALSITISSNGRAKPLRLYPTPLA